MSISVTPRSHLAETLEIALVNNMPDQAIDATRRQFTRLLDMGANGAPFRLRCYALPSVPRSETGRRTLAQTHDDVDALYARGADALIVTGAEPRADTLEQEPYWNDFARLVDWARSHTLSALWSCLSAHAAVQLLDGVGRQRLEKKLSGVFDFEILDHDWANEGAKGAITVPHSRYNGLSQRELEQRGYNISSWSPTAGVDNFWRREPSLFLFTQGHPEYDADTLAREFRRDVLRYLTGERGELPAPPENYFSTLSQSRFEELRRQRDSVNRRHFAERLNQILANEPLARHWSDDAARLYRNWLANVSAEKARRLRNAS